MSRKPDPRVEICLYVVDVQRCEKLSCSGPRTGTRTHLDESKSCITTSTVSQTRSRISAGLRRSWLQGEPVLFYHPQVAEMCSLMCFVDAAEERSASPRPSMNASASSTSAKSNDAAIFRVISEDDFEPVRTSRLAVIVRQRCEQENPNELIIGRTADVDEFVARACGLLEVRVRKWKSKSDLSCARIRTSSSSFCAPSRQQLLR